MISPGGIEPQALDRMSAVLEHRGPDGCGFMFYSMRRGIHARYNEKIIGNSADGYSVGFVHRRLSIIDLSDASRQPMMDESGAYCLVFNGEIYNYRELRAELTDLGYAFMTTGDTEVLLRAYQAWGPACMSRLNGMWAFALLDARAGCVILSRDRFGIKPLYYTVKNNTLCFASEIKGLLAVSEVEREPNERTVARFLLTGLVDDTAETFFKRILKLPAAHWMSVSVEDKPLSCEPQPYWSFPTKTFQGTEQQAGQQFRDLFLDAVRIHLRSDVPVGTCLSGGLDSSSIVCAADVLRRSQAIPNYAHSAFGYHASDETYDETPYMEAVASATAVKMHYVHITQDQFEARLPDILFAQDEPFGSASIVAQWFVFQRAKAEGMKVMLDGQGADETLAGYHLYFSTLAACRLAAGDIAGFWRLRAAYERDIGPFPVSLRSVAGMLLKDLLPGLEAALRRVRQTTWLNPLRMALTEILDRPDLLQPTASEAGANCISLNKRLQRDVEALMLPALLRYEDRNSMAHSIEARVPFLDHRLVEFLFTLPADWKIRGVSTKYILREAMCGILPEVVRTRADKIGFRPSPDLTFSYVQRHRDLFISNQTDWERRWFRPEGVQKLLNGQDRSVASEFGLWRVLNTKLWARQFWG